MRAMAKCGSSIAVQNTVHFSGASTYVRFNQDGGFTQASAATGQLEFYVEAYRALSMSKINSEASGILHGVWYADNIVHSSDRRLKKNIRPLMELFEEQRNKSGNDGSGRELGQDKSSDSGPAWVLRQLRPVAYEFKEGVESKSGGSQTRIGFLADEMSKTIPQVVREPGVTKHQGIVYQDLIAVLTSALQSLQTRFESEQITSTSESQEVKERMDKLDERFSDLEKRLDKMMGSLSLLTPQAQYGQTAGQKRLDEMLDKMEEFFSSMRELRGAGR